MYSGDQALQNNIMQDLMNKKEFQYLFNPKDEDKLDQTNKLQFLKNQLFAYNLANYNTPYSRVLIKHGTGTGKTITGLLIAKSFIDNDKKVLILGQNKQRFYSDAATKPSLGFVDKDVALAYQDLVQEQIKNKLSSKEFRKKMKLLLKDKIKFDMMGYKKFTNTVLGQFYNMETPEINLEFLKQYDGGAIIIDEVHNVYNSEQRNQWGDAILFTSLFLQKNIKIILMSGTPINNSTEIYDLSNLLYDSNLKLIRNIDTYFKEEKVKIDKDQSKYIKDLFRNSLFPSRDIPITSELLQKAFQNKVSFFPQGLNATDIPKLITEGEQVMPSSQLKITIVEPSEHESIAIKSGLQRTDIKDITFFDFCFMKNKEPFYVLRASQKELEGTQIEILKTEKGDRSYISGNILMQQNLKKHSGKMYHLLKTLLSTNGKVVIYHNDVSGTGILTISQMLKQNGFLTETGQQMPDSVCYKCGKRVSTHTNEGDHLPKVTRFALLYGEQNKDLSARILNTFNSQDNIDGSQLRIVIGSVYIRESVDFKEIRHLIIMQQPYNIPQLQQIIGRGIRQGSHMRLMEKERTVQVHILCSPLHEREDYKSKIMDYQQVMKYEQVMNSLALDSMIYFVNQNDIEMKTIQKSVLVPSLGIESLPFDITLSQLKSQPDDITYNAFQYYKQELYTISILLQAAFEKSIVWDYQQLKEFIFTYSTIPNPQKFSEHNLLMMIKRSQYQIINGIVLPIGSSDVDSLFVTNQPKVQVFQIRQYDILNQEMIDEIMAKLLAAEKHKTKGIIGYMGQLQLFYNQIKMKEIHVQLIKFLIKKRMYTELLYTYGNYIYFVGEVGNGFSFPGNGLIHDHNIQFVEINGYSLNDTIYIFRKGQWETTSFNEYNIPKIKDQIIRSKIVGFHSASMDFRIYDPVDITVSQQDKRLLKRGKLCTSSGKHRNQLHKQLQQIIAKSHGQNIFDDIFHESQREKVREFSCDTIELLMMFLQMEQRKLDNDLHNTNWFLLLDDIIDSEPNRTKKKMQKKGGNQYSSDSDDQCTMNPLEQDVDINQQGTLLSLLSTHQ